MKSSVENKIRLGFVVGLAFLLLTSIAALWSAARSVKTFRAVQHTDYVLEQLSETLAAMVDVETGARGFALAGKDEFLQPFNDGQVRGAAALKNLRAATADNPVQQQHIQELEPLIAKRIEIAKEVVGARRAGGSAAAAQETAQGRGKAAMDSVRRVISEMQDVEQRLLAGRSAEAQTTFRTTVLIVSASGTLAIIAVIVAGLIVHRDFSKRQSAEDERDRFFNLLRESEQRWRLMIGGIRDYAIYMLDMDGRIINWNAGAERIKGYSAEEVIGKHFSLFYTPEAVAAGDPADALKIAAETGHFEKQDWRLRKDGTRFWANVIITPVRDDTGKLIGFAKITQDITERKEREERIEKLNEDLRHRATLLEEANRELEAFSYSVSHDLRAPLRHIDGFVDRLNKTAGPQLEDKSRRFLGIIAESARHMGRLIDDLLVFSRMGRTEMQEKEVDLEDMVKGVIADLGDDIKDRKVIFKYRHLPKVLADPAMLRQVFANLIGNAVKYTRTREQAEIEIQASETPKEFTICVRDNGVGFEMEYAHKLFGVFQRLHRAEEFEGTGIGLANVRRIIHRHGGRTWAQGKLNEGATFCFSLPKPKEFYEPTETHIAG